MRIYSLLATTLFVLSAPVSAETLTIGTSADFPPWEYVDSTGHIIGFDRDIGDEICERIGAECTWINQNYDGLLPALAIGKFDLVIAGISINEEREKQVDFSMAYADAPVNFVVPSNIKLDPITNKTELLEFLSEKSIGVQAGTTHELVVVKHIPTANIRVYDRPEQILADINAGRIDVGFTERSVWDDLLANSPDSIQFVGPLLTGADFTELGRGQGIVLSKGRDKLKSRIDKAIAQMLTDGTLTRYSNDSFGYDLSAK